MAPGLGVPLAELLGGTELWADPSHCAGPEGCGPSPALARGARAQSVSGHSPPELARDNYFQRNFEPCPGLK